MADPREEGLIYLDGLIEQLRGRAEAVNSFWLKTIGKRIRELKNLDPSDAAGIAAIRNDTELIADIVDMWRAAGHDTMEDAKNVLRAAARLSMEASPVAQDLDFQVVEILDALYGGILRIDPQDPKKPDRDYFVLSKGHAAPALYAAAAAR